MAEESSITTELSTKNIKNKPYILGISGGSASGKTSVAQIIFKLMGIQDCILISLDSYYKVITPEQRANLSEYNFDHPNAFDFDLVVEHLNDLLECKEIEMPVYNFTVSNRESYTIKIKPSNLIIFEGILALYDKRVRNLMDMKIFVDTDSDVRLARRSKGIFFIESIKFSLQGHQRPWKKPQKCNPKISQIC
jgi:uridine kinase